MSRTIRTEIDPEQIRRPRRERRTRGGRQGERVMIRRAAQKASA